METLQIDMDTWLWYIGMFAVFLQCLCATACVFVLLFFCYFTIYAERPKWNTVDFFKKRPFFCYGSTCIVIITPLKISLPYFTCSDYIYLRAVLKEAPPSIPFDAIQFTTFSN